jgi:hypothetical protein
VTIVLQVAAGLLDSIKDFSAVDKRGNAMSFMSKVTKDDLVGHEDFMSHAAPLIVTERGTMLLITDSVGPVFD